MGGATRRRISAPWAHPTPPAALRSLVENGLMRHARRGPLRHRRLAAARGRLRDPAPQRPRRAAPPRRRHRGEPRGARPAPRPCRGVPHRRPRRRRRGGRSTGPGGPGPVRRPRAISTPCAFSSGPWRSGAGARRRSSTWPRCRPCAGKPEDVFDTLAMVDDDPDDPTVAVERDHTAANARVFTDPATGAARPRGGHGALARARRSTTKRRGATPTSACRTST